MNFPAPGTAPAITTTGCCPLCGQPLQYFFWPIDAFVCPDDDASWPSGAALDRQAGLIEELT
jgi:hypothetical protein